MLMCQPSMCISANPPGETSLSGSMHFRTGPSREKSSGFMERVLSITTLGKPVVNYHCSANHYIPLCVHLYFKLVL